MLRVIFMQSLNQMEGSTFLTQQIFFTYKVISFHLHFYQNLSSKYVLGEHGQISGLKEFKIEYKS